MIVFLRCPLHTFLRVRICATQELSCDVLRDCSRHSKRRSVFSRSVNLRCLLRLPSFSARSVCLHSLLVPLTFFLCSFRLPSFSARSVHLSSLLVPFEPVLLVWALLQCSHNCITSSLASNGELLPTAVMKLVGHYQAKEDQFRGPSRDKAPDQESKGERTLVLPHPLFPFALLFSCFVASPFPFPPPPHSLRPIPSTQSYISPRKRISEAMKSN